MVTPIRIGTTGDYAPFSTRDSNSCFAGFDIDLMEQLIPGPKAFVLLNWRQIPLALTDNHIDLVASGVTITVARKDYGVFSRPYLENRTVVMGRLGTALPVARLGVNGGGYLETVARSRFTHSAIITVENNARLPEQLLAGDFDAFLSDAVEAATFGARQPVSILQTLERQSHALLLGRSYTELQTQVDEGITNLIQTGQLRQLAETYGIDPNLVPSR